MWSAVSKRAVLLSRPLSQAVAPNLVRPSAASLDAAVNGVAAAAAQQQQVVQVQEQRPQQHEVDVRQQQTQEPAIFSESLSPVVMSEPEIMRPKISVVGVGGAGSNAVNNMIVHGLEGVEFIVCNTDAQALEHSMAPTRVQLGGMVTQGLGAGAKPEIGRKSAIESTNDLLDHVADSHMCFVTAGLGGGTGTGAGPIVARALRDRGVLTVGVVTKPFPFEGITRKRVAEAGLADMQECCDATIVIPNQNLFRLADKNTSLVDAFKLADDVLYSGVNSVTQLITTPGLVNLDFADVRAVLSGMGPSMMGTGEAEGEDRALKAAEAAISNPLLEDYCLSTSTGVLINITGGSDLTLFEVDQAARRVQEEVHPDANIIFGSAFDESLSGRIRVSLVAAGIDAPGSVGETTEQDVSPTPPSSKQPASKAAEKAWSIW
jgi:cell division protein FtsZ